MVARTRRHGRNGSNARRVRRTFSSRLQGILAERGLSQTDVHQSVGVSSSSMSEYIAGETLPRIDVLAAIASHLGVPADYFLQDDRREGAA